MMWGFQELSKTDVLWREGWRFGKIWTRWRWDSYYYVHFTVITKHPVFYGKWLSLTVGLAWRNPTEGRLFPRRGPKLQLDLGMRIPPSLVRREENDGTPIYSIPR